MTTEQASALKIIHDIEAKISALEWRLTHYEDLVEWTKGAQKRVARENLRLLRDQKAELQGIIQQIEQAFGVGWVETDVYSYDFESANMPGVKYTHTTRTMQRVDGKIEYKMSVSTESNLSFEPEKENKGGGILAFYTRHKEDLK